MMERPAQILNAASNLLGIALVIIAGLNVSHLARGGFADEVAWGAAMLLCASCVLSYCAIRAPGPSGGFARWADIVFLAGLATLFASIAVLAIENG